MDYAVHVIEETMEKEYQPKVMKAEVKKVKKELPIFQKRNHWCFRHEGVLHKFDSKSEAEAKYLELN